MEPMTMMMLAKGAMSAAQLVSGLAKEKPKRPELKVSGATKEAVNRSRTLANSTTRAGRAQSNQAINQNASNAIQTAKGSTNDVSKLLAVASGVQASSNQAMQGQDALDAQFKQQSEGQYQQALGRQSYEEQMVHQDKLSQYDEAREEKAALVGAGIQNAMTVADDATSMGLYKKFGYLDALGTGGANAGAQSAAQVSSSTVGLNSPYLNNSISRRMKLANLRNSYFKG
jgi:hypothetical protein